VVSVVIGAVSGLAAILLASALKSGLPAWAQAGGSELYGAAFCVGGVAGFLLAWQFNPNRNLWTGFCLICFATVGALVASGYRATLRLGDAGLLELALLSIGQWEVLALVALCLLMLLAAWLKSRAMR